MTTKMKDFGKLFTANQSDRNIFMVTLQGQGRVTSLVQTKDCDTKTHHPAKPVKTTLVKGTTILIEKISIRKGLRGDDHIVFRIPTNRTSPVPSGKFWVSLNNINSKLDASVEIINKYPNGKFILQIIEGREYSACTCRKYPCTCQNSNPRYKKEYLTWVSNPESSSGGRRSARTEHYVNTAGRDTISNEGHRYYCHSEGYSKSFDTIIELLSWAEKKNFNKAHIDAFIIRYNEKKAQWEQDKKDLTSP